MTSTSGLLVQVDGGPLANNLSALLVSAVVDTSLRVPDTFSLRFRDTDRTLLAQSKVEIGSKVRVAVTTDAINIPEPLVSGEVTAVELDFDGTGTFTTIRGYDPAHRLFRGKHTTAYTQTTASDAAVAVARRAGLELGEVTSTGTVFDHLAQCGQSDWEFLDSLAKRVGFEVAVRDNKLDFGPRKAAADAPNGGGTSARDPLVLTFGKDLLRIRSVVTAADQVAKVQVRGWDVSQKKAIVAEASAGTKSAALPTITPAAVAAAVGDPTYVATEVAYRTQPEADSAAAALAEVIGGSFAQVEAVVRGNPKLRADTPICLANMGEPFDGKYLVTAARHRYEPGAGGYTTSLSVTGRQERSLYGLSSGIGGTSGQGVVIAQVNDARDPSQQGRVRLTFPWLSPDYVSDWARVLQPGAGKGRGTLVVPEVGDEVLVAFEQHDPRRPYVLGGLYNGVDTASTKGPALIDSGSGAVNRRSLVSRNGHRLDLLDENGRTEGVTVETGDGKLRLVLDKIGTKVEIHSDGTVLVEGKRGVVIDAAGAKLALTAAEIVLSGKRSVKISGGSGSMTVDTSGVAADGPSVKVSANATAEFKAGGPAVISGTPVKIN
ncbi:type IV secretion protein Rhs (plasmid) [Rhodococcus opacus]|uniref:Type IV secretion protein Rhs n=2 Tax=Rhodococcus opacus TaxID=37919 RepID=A0A076F3I6_RHOOP|nr:type IV secretion protein Rhs [Rhodococcus opacus]